MDICQHRCSGLRVKISYPENANQITLELGVRDFCGQDVEPVEMVLFDLPTDVTDKLVAAFADDDTRYYRGEGDNGTNEDSSTS